MMDWWFAIWECFYYEPIKFFAILIGSMVAIGAVVSLTHFVADQIRFRRWANRQVWYVDGGGNLYRKDHSRDYNKGE